MMFIQYKRAHSLPPVWDEIAGNNIFLKRSLLSKLESLNPCSQTYHLNQHQKIALVSYRLTLDLFTFSKIFSFKVLINVIGIPLSVSTTGYSVQHNKNLDDLSKYIKSLKGFYLILNSGDDLSFAQGDTLPTCTMDLPWSTMEEYICSMRSHYKYRIKKAQQRFSSIQVQELQDQHLFDESLYDLYLNVYENSNEKLEKLPLDFFRSFPSKLFTFTDQGEALGFIQLMENKDQLIFLFGGFKHSHNKQYDLYINMLLKIIQYGIDHSFQSIDLGQTAEETKLKLGSIQRRKTMYAFHSNKALNFIIKNLMGSFSYRVYRTFHRVFKEDEDENLIGKMS